MAKVSAYPEVTQAAPQGWLFIAELQPDGSYETKKVAPDNIGLQGPVGPQGAAGPAGTNGIIGANGTNGTDGAAGATGPTGPTGPTGSQGFEGVPGLEGPRGATQADSHSVVTYNANVALDFGAASNFHTISLTGAITFTSSNLTLMSEKIVRLVCDGTNRVVTFPATWVFVGDLTTANAYTLTANKTLIFSAKSFGTTDASVVAAAAVQS